MLTDVSHRGWGVSVGRAMTSAERIADAADKTQEWVIEELWASAPTNWPRCPNHPDTHPMQATVRAGVAVWSCPADGVAVVAIGALTPGCQAPGGRTVD